MFSFESSAGTDIATRDGPRDAGSIRPLVVVVVVVVVVEGVGGDGCVG